MSDSENIISIKILDRSYKIKCPPEGAKELLESAQHVDNQMRKLRQSGGNKNTDQIAVVTALNICHELILLKNQKSQSIDEMHRRIQELQNKIENSLAIEKEVTI